MTDASLVPLTQESLEIIERRAALESSTVVAAAEALAVIDAPSYVAAGELRKEVNTKDRVLEEEFAKQTRAIDAAKRVVLDFAARARGGYGAARAILDAKMLGFQKAEEEKRRAEEARVREEARKKEEERRLREAEQAVAEGASQEEASALLEGPPPPLPVVPSSLPKIAGQSTRVTWKARVTDLWRLVSFVAQHREFLNLLIVNEAALNALARAQKDGLDLPGVEPFPVETIAGSRR